MIRRFRVGTTIGAQPPLQVVSDVLAGLTVAVSIGAMLNDDRIRPGVRSVRGKGAVNAIELPTIEWQGDSRLTVVHTGPGKVLKRYEDDLSIESIRFQT